MSPLCSPKGNLTYSTQLKFLYFPIYSPSQKPKVSRQVSQKVGLRRVEGRGGKVDGVQVGHKCGHNPVQNVEHGTTFNVYWTVHRCDN